MAFQIGGIDAAVERLKTALGKPPGRMGLAVSGGPDSLALLVLANMAWPGQTEAATVDHGLRPSSADEAHMVGALCADLDVPHKTLAVTIPSGNTQSEARRARYAALSDWMVERKLSALLTAHHADDQAETLLLRLNRGSGVAGLAGVRARGTVPGSSLPLYRPLLDWRKSDLMAICNAAGLAPVSDPFNCDERFDRARLRKVMNQADWLDVPALATSAAHLGDADAALDWAARREWTEQVKPSPGGMVYRPAAPKAIALRVIARIAEELGETPPRGGTVARVFDALVARQPMSLGGLIARPLPEGWSFTRAPLRRAPAKALHQATAANVAPLDSKTAPEEP